MYTDELKHEIERRTHFKLRQWYRSYKRYLLEHGYDDSEARSYARSSLDIHLAAYFVRKEMGLGY